MLAVRRQGLTASMEGVETSTVLEDEGPGQGHNEEMTLMLGTTQATRITAEVVIMGLLRLVMLVYGL